MKTGGVKVSGEDRVQFSIKEEILNEAIRVHTLKWFMLTLMWIIFFVGFFFIKLHFS